MIAGISPDIGFLDLTSALKDAARENNLVFLSDDTHWSSEGHRVVAEALAGALNIGTKMADQTQSPVQRKTKKTKVLSNDAS